LLETTGLANPAPLASVLWLDDQLESAVKLDSIITVSFVFDNSIISVTCLSDLELRLLISRPFNYSSCYQIVCWIYAINQLLKIKIR
jgi:hypothetical protein